MKKTLVYLFILLVNWSAFAGDASIGVDYGLSTVNYEPMSQHKVYPSGYSYGFNFSQKISIIETQFFYRQFSGLEGKFIHAGEANYFVHNQTSVGAAFNVFLNQNLYFKIGYALNKVQQTIKNSTTSNLETDIKSTYQVLSDKSSSGIVYGIGFNIFNGKTFDTYTEFNRYPVNKDGYVTSLAVGFKFNFDFGFSSVFNPK